MNEPRDELLRPSYGKTLQQGRGGPQVRQSLNGAASLRRQRGAMAVAMPFVLLMALAAGALAVDIGHLYVVQAELQTAADAAALAGAASLLPGNGSGPNWSAAQTLASNSVASNSSEGVTLRDSSPTSVQTGYWNVTGTPAQMQPTTITPGNNDTYAVQVTVSREPGLNGGPVSYFLAPLFGMNNGPVSATAVAMVAGPGSIAAGGLFPMAVSKCAVSNYWNTGTPVSVQIGDAGGAAATNCPKDKKGATGPTGAWTNLGTANNNSNPAVRDLMNSNPLKIRDPIAAVSSGARATLYQDVSNYLNTTVLMPIVDVPTPSISWAISSPATS